MDIPYKNFQGISIDADWIRNVAKGGDPAVDKPVKFGEAAVRLAIVKRNKENFGGMVETNTEVKGFLAHHFPNLDDLAPKKEEAKKAA
jgi:hypothetical protein